MDNIIYFDNAATTFPKPNEVYRFMDEFTRTTGVNTGRGQYSLSSRASELVKKTRSGIRELLKVKNSQEVVFTNSATEAINIILQGFPWQGGETVFITPFEHNGVLRCLHYLEKVYSLKTEYLEVDKNSLSYDLDKIQMQFQDQKPALVIMSHASNVTGLIAPIQEISELAKKKGAKVMVDGAQTAGLLPISLKDFNIDYFVFAGHKTLYGPFGIAGFVIDKQSDIKPLIYGGTGIDSADKTLPETIPEKFEVGSRNIQAIAGLHAAISWIQSVGRDEIYHKERMLTKKLVEMLQNYSNIRLFINKDLEKHIGVISCSFTNISVERVGEILNRSNIAVRTGLHCAPDAHDALNTSPGGTVRFSLSYFNSEEDLNKLESALDQIEFA